MNSFVFTSAIKEMMYPSEAITILADYSVLGLKLVKRKSDNEKICSHVIGFMKSDEDIMAGKLMPFSMIYSKEAYNRFHAFPSSPENIPHMTIFDYRGGLYQISREFSVRIKYKKWELIPWSSNYNLIPKERASWFEPEQENSSAPHFLQIMNIEWENNSFERLEESVDLYNRPTYGRVVVRSGCTLTLVLGTHGKGPYIVSWDGRYFSIYSLEGKHLFGINRKEDDDDGCD